MGQTAFVTEPFPTGGIVGANFAKPSAVKSFQPGTVEFGDQNTKWVYGQAAGILSANATVDLDGSFTATAGDQYVAPYAMAAGDYGWFREIEDQDQTVIPFYALSANGASAAVATIVAPFQFRIVRIDTVLLGGALTTGDFTLTAAIGGTPVTGGVVTVTQSGSAAGDKDSATPTAANTGAQGATITLTGGGTSEGNRTINGFLTLERVV